MDTQEVDLYANIHRFMFPALTLSECFGLLAPMKAGMPPEVFNTVASLVRQARGEGDWSRLQQMGIG